VSALIGPQVHCGYFNLFATSGQQVNKGGGQRCRGLKYPCYFEI